MKILCSKENLLYGIQVVQRAVTAKNPLPILTGILMKTEESNLVLTATDLEIGVECKIPVTVINPGSIVLPAKYIVELVRRLPDTKIEISVNHEQLNATIRYGQSELEIKGLSADEFPILPELDTSNYLNLTGIMFKNMVKQVSFAASSDSNRPIFNGVLLELEDNNLKLIATDTHRLTYSSRTVVYSGNNRISIIIPVKALNEVSKLINDDEEVTLYFTENQVLFQINDIRLISRLIDGQFPNYRQVIPQEYKTTVQIKSNDLKEATERAALMARDGSNTIKLTVQEHTLIINANSPDFGKVHEELSVFLNGEETQIAFNSKYLLDVLKVIDTEELSLELTGSLSPGIIKQADSDNYIYLILPLRTI